MLFYNENDEICLKHGDDFKILYECDYFELNGQWYTYSNGYFYDGVEFGDGDYETDWQKRTHPRHMNILEMAEAFAPPSYHDDLLNEVFQYQEELNEDHYFLMYSVARKVDQAKAKSRECVSVCVKDYEFDKLKEEGLHKILHLMHEEYQFELYLEEDKSKHDQAVITLFWTA